jgi:hypothetical protein
MTVDASVRLAWSQCEAGRLQRDVDAHAEAGSQKAETSVVSRRRRCSGRFRPPCEDDRKTAVENSGEGARP